MEDRLQSGQSPLAKCPVARPLPQWRCALGHPLPLLLLIHPLCMLKGHPPPHRLRHTHTNCITTLSIWGPLVFLTADISEILSVNPLFFLVFLPFSLTVSVNIMVFLLSRRSTQPGTILGEPPILILLPQWNCSQCVKM